MTTRTEDGKSIFYDLQGNASANTCLLFLNGLTQTADNWGLVTPYFKESYRLLLLDLIFQGRSEKTGESRNFDQHARDVRTVMSAAGIEKVIVVGISFGSLVAQHFTLLFPECVEGLVLISTFAHKTPYYEAIELSWWRALETGGYNLMLDIMLPSVLSEHYFASPLIPINKMKNARAEANQNSQAIFNLMKATRDRPDYRAHLRKIKAPCLIIQGEKDFLLPVHLAEEVHKNIASSELQVIARAGHTLNLEHVPEVTACLLKFLEKIKE
jgi:3-oxoadipate enol-lactonase